MRRRVNKQNTAIASLFFIAVALILIGSVFLENATSILGYTLKAMLSQTVIALIVCTIGFVILTLFYQKIKGPIRVNNKLTFYGAVIIVILVVNLLVPLTDCYENVVCDGKRPKCRGEYYLALMKDTISKDTETVVLSTEDTHIVTKKVTRRRSHQVIESKIYYFKFYGNDNKLFICHITEEEKGGLQATITGSEKVEITYFKNSGVIDSVRTVE